MYQLSTAGVRGDFIIAAISWAKTSDLERRRKQLRNIVGINSNRGWHSVWHGPATSRESLWLFEHCRPDIMEAVVAYGHWHIWQMMKMLRDLRGKMGRWENLPSSTSIDGDVMVSSLSAIYSYDRGEKNLRVYVLHVFKWRGMRCM